MKTLFSPLTSENIVLLAKKVHAAVFGHVAVITISEYYWCIVFHGLLKKNYIFKAVFTQNV